MEEKSISEYRQVIAACKSLFTKKTKDYGTAWRILRLPSITDQIFIKAKRIRSIQEKQTQMVDESIEGEFVAMINYCIMAMMQISYNEDDRMEIPTEEIAPLYDKMADDTLQLLLRKNHDYGEAWREMRVSSMTDIILMKLLRVKQIEDNQGSTLVSEGVDANYQDIINYSVFCLIKLDYQVA